MKIAHIAKSVTVALVATVALCLNPAGASTDHHEKRDLPNWVTTPCATAHSVNCRLVGKHTSIRRAVPGDANMVCVFYVQPRYAATHDYCS